MLYLKLRMQKEFWDKEFFEEKTHKSIMIATKNKLTPINHNKKGKEEVIEVIILSILS